MNIENLEILMLVEKHGSISRVAEMLNFSQSALSQKIKMMEDELETSLFVRSYNGVIPTENCKIVLKYALEITSSYSEMLELISKKRNDIKNINILTCPDIYSYAMPCTLFHLKTKFPSTEILLEEYMSQTIEEKVLNGTADFGILLEKPLNKKLSSKKMFSDRMCLVASADMKIDNNITLNKLYDLELISMPKIYKRRLVLDNILQSNGLNLNKIKILYELTSTESIKLSITKGYGVAFLPYMSIKKELYNKQLKIIEIENFAFESTYYGIRKKISNSQTNEQHKFINYLEKILVETIC